MKPDPFLAALIGAFTAMVLTFVITKTVSDFSWRADAVAVGHAEFYMNENGARMWRWKGQEK